MKNIIYLDDEFIGDRDVKGFRFKRLHTSKIAQIYKVEDTSTNYDVFLRRFTPVLLDFELRIYSKNILKERYPTSNHFGKTAWHYMQLDQAINKFNELNCANEKD